MAGTSRPPRALGLGVALREMRQAANLTVRGLASQLGISHAAISRWETGDRFPKVEDVAAVLAALGVHGGQRDELLELARDEPRRQWLSIGLPEQRRQLAALVEYERSATSIVCMSPLLVPGPLQTADYARTIMRESGVRSDEIELRVAVRMGRRDILSGPRAPKLIAIVGEAVLHQRIGGLAVMHDQLQRLLDMSEWQPVDLRIIPTVAGYHDGLIGPWIMVELADTDPVVHLETLGSGLFLHEPKDTGVYQRAADRVLRLAMSPEESQGLIADVINRF